jgi:2-oxoglutarate ferredoxin oxidoreductase subunit alpha
MTDLDIGMNERLCDPLVWDDARTYDRGKVLSHEDLESGRRFGRYLDVDDDGITYRTYPGTHPRRGSFFTRGTSRDRYARYTEEGSAYVDNMQRLVRKFETAKLYVPEPVPRPASGPARHGIIYYGSTACAMDEALAELEAEGIAIDAMRVRAFPFHDAVIEFVNDHEHVFVVEQNRDGQLRTRLGSEGAIDPARISSVVHYDGTPITARFIRQEIEERLSAFNVRPLRRTAAAGE